MRGIQPAEIASRIVAALAYTTRSRAEVAATVGIPLGTLEGYASRARRNIPPPAVLRAIALACGVPPAFMEVGFAPFDAVGEPEARLLALEARVLALESASGPSAAELVAQEEQDLDEELRRARESAATPAASPRKQRRRGTVR